MGFVRLLLVLGLVQAGFSPAWAGSGPSLPKEVLVNGVEFVKIPGGEFYLPTVQRRDRRKGFNGDNLYMKDLKAVVDTFYIAKYEARARDFQRLMNEGRLAAAKDYDPRPNLGGDGATTGCAVRKDDAGKYYLVSPEIDLPATHLSWNLARDFAQAMGFRLPSHAEWTRAFRGDDRRLFPWGDAYPDDTFAAFQEGATRCNVQPVTAYPKGRSPYGVYNMAGNVFEFVADWRNVPYTDSLREGARNPVATEPWVGGQTEEPLKMLRGGRWASSVNEISIHANYDTFPPHLTFNCYGVRFALDADAVRRHLSAGTARALP